MDKIITQFNNDNNIIDITCPLCGGDVEMKKETWKCLKCTAHGIHKFFITRINRKGK